LGFWGVFFGSTEVWTQSLGLAGRQVLYYLSHTIFKGKALYIAQAGFTLVILLPQPPECQGCRCVQRILISNPQYNSNLNPLFLKANVLPFTEMKRLMGKKDQCYYLSNFPQ
jgi:hypothetical protein